MRGVSIRHRKASAKTSSYFSSNYMSGLVQIEIEDFDEEFSQGKIKVALTCPYIYFGYFVRDFRYDDYLRDRAPVSKSRIERAQYHAMDSFMSMMRTEVERAFKRAKLKQEKRANRIAVKDTSDLKK